MLRTVDGALQGFVLVSSGFHLNVENSSHLLWFYIVTLPLAEKPRATFSSYSLSEVKPKPIVIGSRSFSRALCQRRVSSSSSDWFIGLSVAFVIG